MFLTSKLGALLTIFLNIERGYCFSSTDSLMKFFASSRMRFHQIRRSSSDIPSTYCTSDYRIPKVILSALKSSIEDDVSLTDYEFLDCGDLKRLERFAGKLHMLLHRSRDSQVSCTFFNHVLVKVKLDDNLISQQSEPKLLSNLNSANILVYSTAA